MTRLSVTFSWPESALWPNARIDRRARISIVRMGRAEGYGATLEALEGRVPAYPSGDVALTLTGYPPADRGYDKDNFLAACISRLDGLAQALRWNDVFFDPHVVWGPLDRPRGHVVIELEVDL